MYKSGLGDEVDWFFNGLPIRISDPFWHGRLTVKERFAPGAFISEIYILPSQMEDAGTYVCSVGDERTDSIDVRVTTPDQDKMETSNETESSESEEVSEKIMKTAQLKFYRDQVLTNTKMRQMMDTEREFYEAMLRFLQEREKENTQ